MSDTHFLLMLDISFLHLFVHAMNNIFTTCWVCFFRNESKGKDSEWHVYAVGFLSLESLTHSYVCGILGETHLHSAHTWLYALRFLANFQLIAIALLRELSSSCICEGGRDGRRTTEKQWRKKFSEAERYRDNDLLPVKPFVHALMISWINLDSIIPRSMTSLGCSISRKYYTFIWHFDFILIAPYGYAKEWKF